MAGSLRGCQDWAGAGRGCPSPTGEQAGPGCQGCRINTAAHRQAAGREGGEAAGRRENRCLRSEADTKDLLSPPPWSQGAAPLLPAHDQGSGQPGAAGGEGGAGADLQTPPAPGCLVFFLSEMR